ncbi:CDP-alcohol phosphatidyltransferase family protein [Haloplanus rallus]|jgi:CDP-diacylglycerol--glycerol-3-phosphate 3-phosphatidyltransferase|uniref:CDP-alcohol phosphatidyltransferase family protein n=1 Tax=Haloplanus rallus TaxID=1816183 RepID=A0A6B9FFI4_9EURY|nr:MULTISPECIES: CDP-alcohol phosphatidyltransferase family protein [Haloplanus]QGX95519.1 CDP-alcohol phosphatidyltransferase family protein [Haloplanus rallus]
MSGGTVRERRLGAAAVTGTAVAAAGVAVGGWTFVADATTRAAANRWALVTGATLCYVVGFLAYHVDADRPAAAAAPPNLVTITRGLLYAAAAGFLVVPPSSVAGPVGTGASPPAVRWAPALCYGAGVTLDFADGRLARRTERTTPLGTKLDHAFDTLGFLVAPLVGVAWGRLPSAYLSLSAARYVYRAGTAWRRRRGRPVGDLPESRVRRPLAALQMAFITVALTPLLPAAVVHPAALVVVVPSLATFVRDYLAVTGRLDG